MYIIAGLLAGFISHRYIAINPKFKLWQKILLSLGILVGGFLMALGVEHLILLV